MFSVTVFSIPPKTNFNFLLSSANAFNLNQHKILLFSRVLINYVPNAKTFDWSKLKAFADDRLNVTQNVKVVFHRIENIVGKEENAGYQHFLLFPRFQRAFSSSASEVVIVW